MLDRHAGDEQYASCRPQVGCGVSEGGGMKVRLIRSTSNTGTCPTIYATDRGTFVVQGTRVTDAEALAAMDIPVHEAVIEVPFDLLRGLPIAELAGHKGR
jgi:hypothetical protein